MANTPLQIMLLGMFFLFYNYYEFGINLSYLVRHYHLSHVNAIYFTFSLTPFAFSSLARPFGGVLTHWWQSKTKNYIFPYLLFIYSIIGLFADILDTFINNRYIPFIIMGLRILQGFLIGGIVPQFMMYSYERSNNTTQRVFYSAMLFICVYSSVIISLLSSHLLSETFIYYMNLFLSIVSILISLYMLHFKSLWHNFDICGKSVSYSLSLQKTIKINYSSIIRFSLFLSFMASLSSFFLGVMPFYLIHYLNYDSSDIFFVVVIIYSCGICGFCFGGYFHRKIGKSWHLSLGVLIKILLYFLFKEYIHHNLHLVEILGGVCLFSLGLMIAKVPVILNSIFPPSSRLYALSLTYNISWGLTFGVFNILVIGLINHFHNLYAPSIVIMIFSYLSIISLWFTPDEDFYRYLSFETKKS